MDRFIMNHGTRIATLILLLLFCCPLGAAASGTYRGGAPRKPAGAMDREAYQEGKLLYGGQASLKELQSESHAAQTAVLVKLQERLPRTARAKVDLPSLAGRLSDQQLASLKYFLRLRYKVKLDAPD